MSQMNVTNDDFGAVEFTIEQDGHLVWLRWRTDGQDVLLGPAPLVAAQFQCWLDTQPQHQPTASQGAPGV